MSKRAERRHHRRRLLNKRKQNWGGYWKDDRKALARMVDTPTPCSCWMCGNDRRGNRRQDKTWQEIKFLIKCEEEC